MKQIKIIFFLLLASISTRGQDTTDFQIRIYRSEFIYGTVSQLRLNADLTYKMQIVSSYCSLCDRKELSELINTQGSYLIQNDTLYLDQYSKFKIENDSILIPLEWNNPNSRDINSKYPLKGFTNFYLVYDTYPDGMVKFIYDKYRSRTTEFEFMFDENGILEDIRHFKNDKLKKIK